MGLIQISTYHYPILPKSSEKSPTQRRYHKGVCSIFIIQTIKSLKGGILESIGYNDSFEDMQLRSPAVGSIIG